jgi:hypothetical protein
MMRAQVVIGAVMLASACATAPQFHSGPTSLSGPEQRAMLAAPRSEAGWFERFWLRPGCQLGVIKWSEERSQAVAAAPPGLLDLVRDELGRLNRKKRAGEVVYVSVTVFEWRNRIFGLAPRVGYEVIGRDRAGQIIWMAEDHMVAPRELAKTLVEGDDLVVAREVGRKTRMELGL